MGIRSWDWGAIRLDARNMEGGELAVVIVSEEVHGGFDGTNYGE